MRVVVGVIFFLFSLIELPSAYANSYLEMITTAPVSQEIDAVVTEDKTSAEPLNWWYDSRIVTSSPVVMSSYPKYYAWARSQAFGDFYDESHEQIQNLIYAVEGGLLGWGLYELYKY